MFTKFLSGVMSLTLLSGCSGGWLFSKSSAEQSKTKIDQLYDTRVYIAPQCLVKSEALPALLIPVIAFAGQKVIETGVAYIGKKLEDAKESYKATYTGRNASYFYRKVDEQNLAPAVQCIAIGRGQFGKQQQDPVELMPEFTKSNLVNMGLVTVPDFYLQAKLQISDDKQSFRVQPDLLYFGHPLAKNSDETKDLTISLTFEPTSSSAADANAKAFGKADLTFKNVVVGSRLKGEALKNMTTQWMPLPAISAEAVKAVPKEAVLMPFSVLISVKEESEAGDLLLKASETYSASKDKLSEVLSEALKKAISPSAGGADQGTSDQSKSK